ncbi:MAG: haloacid dehalogenase-like hydrolase [Alphaproteobacteria bacterium]|nr:haloacid dehalogenase-like hydrolase [Alphaproteobacteria bacterium]
MKVVLFDFDGTLSSGDANRGFYRYTFWKTPRQILFLPWVLVGGVGRLLNPGGVWWRQVMRRYLTPGMVKKYAPGFIKQHKMNRFGWAKERVTEEKRLGNVAICISAGVDYLIPELVKDLGFDVVICSEADKARPWGYKRLCWGRRKVDVLGEWSQGVKLDVVRAYSDSKSDLPMMKLAKEQVWINPKTGCRK